MLAPERRSPGDLIAAGVIVLVAVIFVVTVWLHSDARGTKSITAQIPAKVPDTALQVPDRVTELWRAPNGASRFPLVAGGTVVTADGGTVLGHDPSSGRETWRYSRTTPLCGVVSAWNDAVAVYRDTRGCSQVTELKGADGRRVASRNSAADAAVHVSADGTYTVSQGDSRLEVWRSDMVRTIEYGRVDAPVNPKSQPRTGCKLLSSAASSSRLAVLELCPKDDSPRLTILNPAPKDNTKPEEYGSAVLTDIPTLTEDARIIATYSDKTAVYLPGRTGQSVPRIGVYDASANLVAQYPISGPITDEVRITRVGSNWTVWTGTQLLALSSDDLRPIWARDDVIGPGVLMAGEMLAPTTDGIMVIDPVAGTEISRIPVVRNGPGAQSPITLAVSGRVILEQRAKDVVALG